MLEPWLLLQSILAGIAVAAPVGPMSLLCMQRTLHSGPGAGAGVRRWDRRGGRVLRHPRRLQPDRGYLAAARGRPMAAHRGRTGVALFRAAHPARTAARAGTRDRRRLALARFATAYGLTLANPPTILLFAGLFASLAPLSRLSQAVVFTGGMFAGSLLWWVVLTGALTVTASKLSPSVLRWINRASALALIGLALYALIGVTLSAPS